VAYDPDARRALEPLDKMQMALVDIGTCEIVEPLVPGDNFFTTEQFQHATELGAVGQVNLRFIAEDGTPVISDLDDLAVGVTLEQLHQTERVLAVAGGRASTWRSGARCWAAGSTPWRRSWPPPNSSSPAAWDTAVRTSHGGLPTTDAAATSAGRART
jgi:hypothetical protein